MDDTSELVNELQKIIPLSVTLENVGSDSSSVTQAVGYFGEKIKKKKNPGEEVNSEEDWVWGIVTQPSFRRR